MKLLCNGVQSEHSPQIVKGNSIPSSTALDAIQRINLSVNWEYNNDSVINYYRQGGLFFAICNEEIIGYLTHRRYTKSRKEGVSHFYVNYIAVHCSSQGEKGGFAAIQLMQHAFDVAKRQNESKLMLSFRANKPKTVAFYDKLARIHFLPFKDKDAGFFSNGDPETRRTFYLNK